MTPVQIERRDTTSDRIYVVCQYRPRSHDKRKKYATRSFCLSGTADPQATMDLLQLLLAKNLKPNESIEQALERLSK